MGEWLAKLLSVRMGIRIAFTAFLLAGASTVVAHRARGPQRSSQVIDGFEARQLKQPNGATVGYRLFVPAAVARRSALPLVIWFHGADGTDTDNAAQVLGDQQAGTRVWTREATQAAHPAFVLAPQSPLAWGYVDDPKLERIGIPDIAALVGAVAREFRIDDRRIYLAGQSAGVRGLWAVVNGGALTPAAVVLVCPEFKPQDDSPSPSRMVHVPMWAFVGKNDPGSIGLAHLITQLRAAGGTPRVTEYAGMGHDIWARAFSEPGLVDWVLAQHR
jgi:predicted peptidase